MLQIHRSHLEAPRPHSPPILRGPVLAPLPPYTLFRTCQLTPTVPASEQLPPNASSAQSSLTTACAFSALWRLGVNHRLGSDETRQVKGQNLTFGKINGNIIQRRETMRSPESPGRSQGRSSHPRVGWLEPPRKNEQLGNPNSGIAGNLSKKGPEQARAWQEMGSVMV